MTFLTTLWALKFVALSTADSNKWSLLLEARQESSPTDRSTSSDYQRSGPIRQRQRRLTEAQASEMAALYEEGATAYQLAAQFASHRTTVAARLKKAGITMRLQSPPPEVIDEMVHLYESGLSSVKIGAQVGYGASTILNLLRMRGIQTRDTHGRAY